MDSGNTPELEALTPEQMEQLRREGDARDAEEREASRREADQIDPERYRKRNRAMAAVALGAFGAGVVFVVTLAIDQARNPCDRVRDYYCHKDPQSNDCKNYGAVAAESTEDPNSATRSGIRHQCDVHIKRLKLDEGIVVP